MSTTCTIELDSDLTPHEILGLVLSWFGVDSPIKSGGRWRDDMYVTGVIGTGLSASKAEAGYFTRSEELYGAKVNTELWSQLTKGDEEEQIDMAILLTGLFIFETSRDLLLFLNGVCLLARQGEQLQLNNVLSTWTSQRIATVSCGHRPILTKRPY